MADHVTLVIDEKRKAGKETKFEGRLSFRDYEVISQADREKRSSCQNSALNIKQNDFNFNLKDVEFGAQEVGTIIEREISLEQSHESIPRLTSAVK